MPSHAPRNEPIRKKEQLLERSEDLRLALFHNKSASQIEKLAERFKDANISLIKAKIHRCIELEYRNKPQQSNIEKLNLEKRAWKEKSIETVVEEFKHNL